MSELLLATAVDVAYASGTIPVVRGVDLTVAAGVAVGIVGESGCGKTSLARALVGVLEPQAGSVEVRGRPWAAIDRRDPLRRSVQMIFQDPYASLNPGLTARTTIAEVLQVWDSLGRRDALARAAELLAEVGLTQDAIDRRPRELSGGQCQRIGIARALACRPDVLVADEPTSSLDVSVQAQILNLLKRLRLERALALVLVSHDLSVIRYMTEETLVMYRGRIVERGPTEQLFAAPHHPYTRLLLDSLPGAKGHLRAVSNDISTAGGCVFAERCPRIGANCVELEPSETVRDDGSYRCHHPLVSDGSAWSALP